MLKADNEKAVKYSTGILICVKEFQGWKLISYPCPEWAENDGFKIATRRTKVRHWEIFSRNSGTD